MHILHIYSVTLEHLKSLIPVAWCSFLKMFPINARFKNLFNNYRKQAVFCTDFILHEANSLQLIHTALLNF